MKVSLTSLRRLLGLGALLVAGSAAPAAAQTAYALTQDINGGYGLATFQVTAPGTFTATVVISGLAATQDIAGIDVRPATGQLYALGYDDALTTNNAQLYTLSPVTGQLTPVGGLLSLPLGSDYSRVGFDFNPTVDRIRVTGGNGGNLRLNPATGAVAATDTNLAYATTDPNAGQTPGVGSSAYTNSYIGATATVLYDVDDKASRLVRQEPPNNGTLNTVGPLGAVTNPPSPTQGIISDLDIYFNPTTGQNVAYLSLCTVTITSPAPTFTIVSQLYTVNLATGATTAVGALGPQPATTMTVNDIAVANNRPTLAPITGNLAYALAGTNLLTFDTALPGVIRTAVGITGVATDQTLVGLDVRPLNNALYALGYNGVALAITGAPTAQLYTLNPTTGVALAVGAPVRLDLGLGNLGNPNGVNVGFDFNPTVDRIRVVAPNRNNYRLNPVFGAASVLAATDAPVYYPGIGTGPPVAVGAVAYTNSFGGSTSTVLYAYDLGLNQLNTQNTAAGTATDGQLTPVGNAGIVVGGPAVVDLDIYSPAAGQNTAYLVANTGTSANTALYTVNLTTGAATLVGAIGNGISARNIAVAAASGVGLGSRPAALAAGFTLYPNPATGSTTLAFDLPRPARVQLVVSDALGRLVATQEAGLLPAGPRQVRWESVRQPAGLYFVRLVLDGQPAGTRQLTLLD